MLHSTKELQNYTVRAEDGDVGKIYEFYFDDKEWTIPYLVIDTGTWLPGRKIMMPVDVFGQVDQKHGILPVALTIEEVRSRPDVTRVTSVSEHYESSKILGPYAGPPLDQLGEGLFDEKHIGMDPDSLIQTVKAKEEAEERLSAPVRKVRTGGGLLQSTRQIIGYYIQAQDDEIGHVEDFIIDADTWTIRYMIIDTVNWLPGKKVLVSPAWIDMIDWNSSKVYVNLSQEAVKNSPVYDSSAPLSQVYEDQLYAHYNRPKNGG